MFDATKPLNLSAIRIDGGTQSRSRIVQDMVDNYAAAMAEGAEFPPVVAFFDGKDYWLADGFHRYHAVRKNRRASIVANIRNGTVRDAILYSFGANGMHGMQMTKEDKRHIVLEMLNDFEWNKWSDREIGRACHVSHTFVSRLRGDEAPQMVMYTKADGTVSQQKRNVGPSRTKAPAKKAEPVQDVPQVTHSFENEQAETIKYLINENEKLTDQLASKSAPDPKLAEETIAELREEIRVLRIELGAVKTSRDQFQAENSQLKKQVASYQRQLKKAA